MFVRSFVSLLLISFSLHCADSLDKRFEKMATGIYLDRLKGEMVLEGQEECELGTFGQNLFSINGDLNRETNYRITVKNVNVQTIESSRTLAWLVNEGFYVVMEESSYIAYEGLVWLNNVLKERPANGSGDIIIECGLPMRGGMDDMLNLVNTERSILGKGYTLVKDKSQLHSY